MRTCPSCGGSGYVRTGRGSEMGPGVGMQRSACDTCSGRGTIAEYNGATGSDGDTPLPQLILIFAVAGILLVGGLGSLGWLAVSSCTACFPGNWGKVAGVGSVAAITFGWLCFSLLSESKGWSRWQAFLYISVMHMPLAVCLAYLTWRAGSIVQVFDQGRHLASGAWLFLTYGSGALVAVVVWCSKSRSAH